MLTMIIFSTDFSCVSLILSDSISESRKILLHALTGNYIFLMGILEYKCFLKMSLFCSPEPVIHLFQLASIKFAMRGRVY